jgi:hypothetical protein
MLCTCPIVPYALSMTSRYQKYPDEDHWTDAKNIVKYLRMTKDLILIYGNEDISRLRGIAMLVSKPTMTIQNHRHGIYTYSIVELSVGKVPNKTVRLTPLWRLSIWLLVRHAK